MPEEKSSRRKNGQDIGDDLAPSESKTSSDEGCTHPWWHLKPKVAALCLAATFLLQNPSLKANSDNIKLHIRNQTPLMEVGEIIDPPGFDSPGWESIYSAYSCVYHHSYKLASRWLMSALKEGAGNKILKARFDVTFLAQGLTSVAAKRHQAEIPNSSCDAQILQALMESVVSPESYDAIDTLKRVVLNNRTYPNLKFVHLKIREMEFDRSGSPWLNPSDVAQSGGKRDGFSKWRMDKFPLKVFVPTDANASKVAGYKVGDGKLLRTAFETWQRERGGKTQFMYEPVQARAEISCEWVSDQKQLGNDVIGNCSRVASANNYLTRATVRILTFATGRNTPAAFDDKYRKACLEETCLHEIGHSLGLNHSSSDKDVMWANAHLQPNSSPTNNDFAALNSLYRTNLQEDLSAAIDSMQFGNYKAAVAPLDKAIKENPKDNQTLNTICICLNNAATAAIQQGDYALAIELLTKANKLASTSETNKQQILKSLHHAYLQHEKEKEAAELEKQYPFLASKQDSAKFLDQYGLKREALPKFEEALAKSPDDLAIREKFCFLLVTLAKDESNQNHDDEAIALLTRAKGLLRDGSSLSIINKVYTALRQAFLNEDRYDEADQVFGKEVKTITPPYKGENVAPEDAIAQLVSRAKEVHPTDWSGGETKRLPCAKIASAYEQYVNALRQCAKTMKAKNGPTWAAVFVVRTKQHDVRGAQDPLGRMFALRHTLIDLTDENAVVSLEVTLAWDPAEQAQASFPSPK